MTEPVELPDDVDDDVVDDVDDDVEDDGVRTGEGGESETRQRLLTAVVEHVRSSGLGEQSLRQMAEAVGTSHRMLLYHFGSRDELARAVAERSASRHRDASLRLTREGLLELSREHDFAAVWQSALAGVDRDGPLVFELWVRAMAGAPDSGPAWSGVGAESGQLIEDFWVSNGYDRPVATDLAAMQIAIGRGLVLDRLLGGEVGELASWLGGVFHPDQPAVRRLLELHPMIRSNAAAAAAADPGRATASRPAASVREQLLDDLLDNLASTGFGRLSLRRLAVAAGTSHRMLVYHFGSRDGLLAAVVARVEQHQADDLAQMAEGAAPADPNDLAWSLLWNRIMSRFDGSGPLVFELAIPAVRGEQPAGEMRALLIDSYAESLARLWRRRGLDAATAATAGRVEVALARGLMIDYLTGGDLASTHAVLGCYKNAVLASTTSGG